MYTYTRSEVLKAIAEAENGSFRTCSWPGHFEDQLMRLVCLETTRDDVLDYAEVHVIGKPSEAMGAFTGAEEPVEDSSSADVPTEPQQGDVIESPAAKAPRQSITMADLENLQSRFVAAKEVGDRTELATIQWQFSREVKLFSAQSGRHIPDVLDELDASFLKGKRTRPDGAAIHPEAG